MLNSLSSFWSWYAASGLPEATLSIPMMETVFLFIILAFCLLFRISRTGLLVAYLFVYRWGWNFHASQVFQDPKIQVWAHSIYIICGILVFTFAVIGMIYSAHREA